jgi:hypothetical protein
VKRGMLYLGTENALYLSLDDGQHWLPLQAGLPHAPVHWLTIQEHFNDLVVGTYGRGFWILDDITPLRQLTPQVVAADAFLFTPRPAYRFRPITEPMTMPDDATEGKNPPEGADITFWLKSPLPKDSDDQVKDDAVQVVVSDGGGRIVRTLKAGKRAEPGINRVWWDLRYDPTTDVTLRTSPLYAPEFKGGADGTRKLPAGGPLSVLAPPGTYTVKLVVNGQEFAQALTVRKDPNTAGSEGDIQAQTKAMLEIRDTMNDVVRLINQAESIRAQLAQLKAVVGGDDEAGKAVRMSADDLDTAIVAVESRLFNMTATGRGQDMLRMPNQLIEKLSHVADVVSLADFPPTDQALEVMNQLTKQVRGYQDQMKQMVDIKVAAFNKALRDRGMTGGVMVMPLR